MTDEAWRNIVGGLTANWPHQLPPKVALQKWRRDLDDLDAAQVETAIEAIYREGREFPPNGAQIRKKVIELAADVPTWGEVWDRLLRAAQRFGRLREQEAFEWLDEWSPLAGRFARQLPFREFCLTEDIEVTHGQARRQWEQMVRRFERDSSLFGLPSAGLKAVEQANSGPRQIGEAILAALPPAPSTSGSEAA